MVFSTPFVGVSPATTTSHFYQAADPVRVTRSAASFAVTWATPSTDTTTMAVLRQNSATASQPGQRLPTAAFPPLTVKKSVSTTTLPDPMPTVPMPRALEPISALTAVPNPIMPSLGSVELDPCRRSFRLPAAEPDIFLSSTASQFLPYRDFSSSIIHRDSFNSACKDPLDQNIFPSIIHPYDTDAFNYFISKHDLTFFYSLLVTNLRNGFPLGHMPPLIDTVIFKNHPSAFLHSDVVNKYLTDELDAGRMSGPFSLQQAENILHGAIFCSPLLVSVQIQQPGMPDKLRVCRHLSKGDKSTPSMNSHIHKEDFPTRFDTASRVADIVGLFPPTSDFDWLPFSLGSTSGGPHLYELHLWWLASSWVHF